MKLFHSGSRRATADTDQVAGERGAPVVARTLSLQARLSNALALGLMLLLGTVLLSWYYAHTLARPRPRALASNALRSAADMTLPPLGPLGLPLPATPSSEPAAVAALEHEPPTGQSRLATVPALELMPGPVGPAPSAVPADQFRSLSSSMATNTSNRALERRLSGQVFVAASNDLKAPPLSGSLSAGLPTRAGVDEGSAAVVAPVNPIGADAGSLSNLLSVQPTAAVSARVLPGGSLLLPKGTFIDCTLETAIDSSLPGMVTCITATDTFGVDGRVVLLERGTKLVGETRGQVQQGAARVFVVWTEARTPTGVIVPLDSPGADELGRSGLPGQVERHFWQRFGAALLISVIDGAVQAAVQSSSRDGGTVIYNPSGSQEIMSEILKGTVAIPPTVIKSNGDRVQVLVARDIDFRGVYELRHVDPER